MFAILFKCKKRMAYDGSVMTREDKLAWVCVESEGWVPATATAHCPGVIPGDVKVFSTQEKADKFMSTWEGHPWYYVPNGSYELIEVKPKLKTITCGYKLKR